jgi:ankyrin repeat protein
MSSRKEKSLTSRFDPRIAKRNMEDLYSEEYPDYCEEEYFSPLHVAISSGQINEIEAIISSIPESNRSTAINARDYENYTPLQTAISSRDYDTVQLLLSHGANPTLSAPNDYGDLVDAKFDSSCLAAMLGDISILRLVLDTQELINAEALYQASECGRLDCVEEILQCVPKDCSFANGVTRQQGIENALRPAVVEWRVDILRLLLDTLEFKNTKKLSELLLLVPYSDNSDQYHIRNHLEKYTPEGKLLQIQIYKLLIGAGARVDAIYNDEDTAWPGKTSLLHMICSERVPAKEVWELLLEHGADIHALNSRGQTPLFPAVERDNLDFVSRLVALGAAIDVTDNEGNTTLHYSIRNPTPSGTAASVLLYSQGAKLDIQNQDGNAPLHYLAQYYRAAYLPFLQDLMSHPEVFSLRNAAGDTPFQIAAKAGHNIFIVAVLYLLARRQDHEKELSTEELRLGAEVMPNNSSSQILTILRYLTNHGPHLTIPITEDIVFQHRVVDCYSTSSAFTGGLELDSFTIQDEKFHLLIGKNVSETIIALQNWSRDDDRILILRAPAGKYPDSFDHDNLLQLLEEDVVTTEVGFIAHMEESGWEVVENGEMVLEFRKKVKEELVVDLSYEECFEPRVADW